MMTKEQKDLTWASLPKETRDSIRRVYAYSTPNTFYNKGFNEAIEEIFGKDNLSSDTESGEVLTILRKDIIEEFNQATADLSRTGKLEYKGKRELLKNLFGDKCLPDKELEHRLEQTVQESVQVKSKPKFKVGDKVRVIEEGIYKGFITEVIGIDESDDDCLYQIDSYRAFEEGRWFSDSDLEPYTEENLNLSQNTANCDKSKDNQLKDNMERKEPCTLTISLVLNGNDDGSFYNERFNLPFNAVEEVMDAAWDLKKYLQDKYRKR